MPVLLMVVGVVAVLGAACVPSNRSEVSEVDPADTTDPADTADDSIAEVDELDRDALVLALAADLAQRPDGLEFWVPPEEEVSCASARIIDGVGSQRLRELGYRPAFAGSSLGELEFSEEEQSIVVDAFVACVDLNEAIARIFFGRGRLPASVATCMADGLEGVDQLEPFVAAAALGRPVDPFDDDGALATAMSAQAAICIPDNAFNWPDLRLPDRDPVLDRNAQAGTSGSRFEDDQTTTTETTP